jgi:hypothetical protein
MMLIAPALFLIVIGVLPWLVDRYSLSLTSGKSKTIVNVVVLIYTFCFCLLIMIMVGPMYCLLKLEEDCRIKAARISAALKTRLRLSVHPGECSREMKPSGVE